MPASKVRRQDSVKIVGSIKSEVLYFLAPQSGNFVKSIVKIMEDEGPWPMRNMRPAQKQRTAADKFQNEHHGQYEARGRRSRDEVGRVHAHNNAYPKMYDELDNRRATAKPSMRMERNTSHRARTNPLCCRCLRVRNRETHLHRYSRSPNRRIRSHKMKSSRVTKPKQKFTRKYNQSRSRTVKAKLNLSKGCQYYPLPVETKSVSTYDDDYPEDNMPGSTNNQESNHRSQEIDDGKELRQENSAISVADAPKSEHSQNPGTSAPSISSYNSYMSITHEPMVD